MEKVTHVPAGQGAVAGDFTHTILVAFPKQLHAHYGKDEDDNGQHQRQVSQSPHRVTDYFDQGIQSRPRLGQLEHP